jgi:hypothetical protein
MTFTKGDIVVLCKIYIVELVYYIPEYKCWECRFIKTIGEGSLYCFNFDLVSFPEDLLVKLTPLDILI